MINNFQAEVASRPVLRSGFVSLGDWKAIVIVGALAACAPLVLGSYSVRVATTVLMFVALAQAWNLIGGYAGLLSVAHPAFFGIGAIGFTIMLMNGIPLVLSAAGACVLAVGLALLVGVPTLRLRGHYFVIATLLISEGMRSLALNFDALGFNGGLAVNINRLTGMRGVSAAQYNRIFFYAMLAMAMLSMIAVYVVDRGRWGYALRAFRDNREAAGALGVPSTRVLTVIFLISAALTALTGSIWAAWLGVVDANEAFGLKLAFEIVVMVYLGGKGTVWGPVIGVFALLLLDELIGVEFAEFTLVSSGLIVMLVILFLPDGLIRLLQDGPRALSTANLKANLTRYRIS
jgi:branched-chain amino acid transport system permease protein